MNNYEQAKKFIRRVDLIYGSNWDNINPLIKETYIKSQKIIYEYDNFIFKNKINRINNDNFDKCFNLMLMHN